MAERTQTGRDVLSDVILPLFALVSSASGGNGPANARALGSLIGRRTGLQGRNDPAQDAMDAARTRQPIQSTSPSDALKAAQAQFQLGSLQDISQQINAPGPGAGASREALGPAQTGRLQEALGRGEQVPLPVEAPTPQVRGERIGQIAATPAGRGQLEAAGLGRVAATGGVANEQANAERQRLIPVKQQALSDLRGYTPDVVPPELQQLIGQSIARAQTSEELFAVVAHLPSGILKPKSARIEEYQFFAQQETAQGRTPPNFLEFQIAQRKAGANRLKTVTNVGPTGVQYGDPPKDTAWARNPDGTVLLDQYGPEGQLAPVAIPVRGGAAYRDIQEASQKGDLTRVQAEQAAGIVVDTINRSLTIMDDSILPTTGLIGSIMSNVQGTDAFNLRSQLDTIRSNIGFQALQRMRASSPTGGALGQVSDTENRLLQSVFGSLQQGQDKAEISGNLNRIREIYLDVLHGVNRPNRQLQYLTQEDIATLNQAQQVRGQGPDPSLIQPGDLENMTPEQLDALEQRLQQGSTP